MELALKEPTHISRPLHVLVPLIKQDLEDAQEAGMPYYKAAGEKMIEAKAQMQYGEFTPWLKRNFNLSASQSSRYMKLAAATSSGQISRARDFSPHYMSKLDPFIDDTDTIRQRREKLIRCNEAFVERLREVHPKLEGTVTEPGTERPITYSGTTPISLQSSAQDW